MKNTADLGTAKGSGFGIVDKYKKLYVAKFDTAKGIEKLADLRGWQAWNGKRWAKGAKNAVSIIPENDSISDELSIKRLNIGGKPVFVMVTFDTAVGYQNWKDLYLYSACEPQGPFTDKYFVYRTPTAGQTRLP